MSNHSGNANFTRLTPYQEVIHKTRYAKWNEEAKRREDLDETLERYLAYFNRYLKNNFNYVVPALLNDELFVAMRNLGVQPSMRALMTAGPALDSAQMANYNCTYLPIDAVESFTEMMYVLMTGSGVGFSVERVNVDKLPRIVPYTDSILGNVHVIVDDSREGWCDAYGHILDALFRGQTVTWDVSRVRPAGARLKTFGGYSSGPEPLVDLFKHTVEIFSRALLAGRKRLRPIDVFSMCTMIAQIVVVGGVRRSATICLFDKDDVEMLNAKGADSQMYVMVNGKLEPGPNAHYAMANISAVFEETPTEAEFKKFWAALRDGGFGEPGIFNRAAVREAMAKIGRPNHYKDGTPIAWGVNPCCEIILRPYQACNLSSAVIRAGDTYETLAEKVRLATILGTWQATVTQFQYLRPIWRENIEEEALLGVCLSGFYDHHILGHDCLEADNWLHKLQQIAWRVNRELAKEIGINPATSVTAVKPSGNSGELADSASGIHPRYAKYYIRRVRQSGTDPMTAFLEASGVPCEVSKQNARDRVFSFPIKAPEGAVTANELCAVQQLNHWLHVKKSWATHTVSCSIYVKPHEWADVEAWVFEHFDEITGLSFFPYYENNFEQAPFEEITLDQYTKLCQDWTSSIDWSLLKHFESEDVTKTGQEFTCIGGACTL